MTPTAATDSSVSIETRLSRIEELLLSMSKSVQQAPVMLSMATDTVDELMQNASEKGIDVDNRLQQGMQLLIRLSDPKINTALNGLLDFVEQGPGLISMVGDAVDEGIGQANAGPVKMDDRINGLTSMLTTLSDPATIDRLQHLIKLGEQAPGMLAMTMDAVDDFMATHGADISSSMAFLQKDNLLFLKNVGDAMTEAQNEPPAKVGGLFGMLRTLKDPGRQKALGFLMNVLKNLGNKI